MNQAVPAKSAIGTLLSISQKKPTVMSPALSAQSADPAIAGAKRDKNTVKLGFDPGFTERAAQAATIKAALERAESDFEIVQAELRDYGKEKRALYNDAFKTVVTTVCVPYSVETPTGPETKYIQVVCSNKYSCQKDMLFNNTDTLGDWMDRLFNVEESKELKPNAEELIRNILVEAGLSEENLESAMESLFETKRKISTRDNYEQESVKAPDHVKAILDQAVTRAQPGLKF